MLAEATVPLTTHMNMPRRSLLRPAWPLVACLAVALLWPASEVWYAVDSASVPGWRGFVFTGPGWIAFDVARAADAFAPRHLHGRVTGATRPRLQYTAIFSRPGNYRFWCPLWVVALCAGVFAAGLLTSRVRRAAIPPGHCQRCGYDLRASPERCPECGTSSRPISPSV